MRIADHAYLGWELEPGSPISRDPFAAARIRPQVPLDAGLLWGQKGNLVVIGRTAGPPQLGVFLVHSDESSLNRGDCVKHRTMDLWDPSTEMHSLNAGMVGQ